MTKTELCGKAKISTNAMAHLGKDEDIRIEVLVKIVKFWTVLLTIFLS